MRIGLLNHAPVALKAFATSSSRLQSATTASNVTEPRGTDGNNVEAGRVDVTTHSSQALNSQAPTETQPNAAQGALVDDDIANRTFAIRRNATAGRTSTR